MNDECDEVLAGNGPAGSVDGGRAVAGRAGRDPRRAAPRRARARQPGRRAAPRRQEGQALDWHLLPHRGHHGGNYTVPSLP